MVLEDDGWRQAIYVSAGAGALSYVYLHLVTPQETTYLQSSKRILVTLSDTPLNISLPWASYWVIFHKRRSQQSDITCVKIYIADYTCKNGHQCYQGQLAVMGLTWMGRTGSYRCPH